MMAVNRETKMHCVICGVGPVDKYSKEAHEWDWFTNRLPNTVHFCPKCKISEKRDEIWRESQIERAQESKKLNWC